MAVAHGAGIPTPPNQNGNASSIKGRQSLSSLERFLSIGISVIFFSAWEFQSRSGNISTLFYPPPSKIISSLFSMTLSGELWEHFYITIYRIFFGFFLGWIPGTLLGLFMGKSKTLKGVMDTYIAILHPIPKIAVLPLFILILGIDDKPRIAIIALSTFFPMVINSMAGVASINPIYFQVAKNYGAGTWEIFRRVMLPASLPLILSGTRIAINMALTITIAVEVIFSNKGLGSIIWLSWQTLRTEKLYTSLLVIAALGIAFNILLSLIKNRLAPWHRDISTIN